MSRYIKNDCLSALVECRNLNAEIKDLGERYRIRPSAQDFPTLKVRMRSPYSLTGMKEHTLTLTVACYSYTIRADQPGFYVDLIDPYVTTLVATQMMELFPKDSLSDLYSWLSRIAELLRKEHANMRKLALGRQRELDRIAKRGYRMQHAADTLQRYTGSLYGHIVSSARAVSKATMHVRARLRSMFGL